MPTKNLTNRLNVPASVIHEKNGKTYKLNGKILSINESAGVCSMAFRIKETGKIVVHDQIPMNKVAINEGFLDAVKNYGQKIGKRVGEAVNWVVRKVKGFIVAVSGNKMLPVFNAPINMAIAQGNGALDSDNISIMPSQSLQSEARRYGATAVSKEPVFEPSNEERRMIRDFWLPYIKEIGDPRNEALSVHECIQRVNSRKKRALNEAIKSLSSSEEYERFLNVNTAHLKSMIVDSIKSQCKNKPGECNNNGKVLIIWGAPGIGKTQIVKQASKLIKEMTGGRANMSVITINAASMMPDEFTLPSVAQTAAGYSSIIDVPKYWMPVFEPSNEPVIDKEGNVIGTQTQVINKFFNTGRLETTNVKDKIEYDGMDEPGRNGGIIFIDEFSRMIKASQNIIMNLVLDRNYNGKVMANHWAFIGAANRKSDMSADAQDTFKWEDANATRFTNVNFVPTRQEWLAWATAKNEDGVPNVEPIITNFIEASSDAVWYDALDFGSRADIRDEAGNPITTTVTKDMDDEEYAQLSADPKLAGIMTSWNPRTWTSVSDMYRDKYKELMGTDYKYSDDNDPWDEDIFGDPKDDVSEEDLERRWSTFYNSFKDVCDPQGRLKRRTAANIETFMLRWLESIVIPGEHGTNNITTKKFKEYNDYLSVFNEDELNYIWEHGQCSFKEDLYRADKQYLDNNMKLKWKTSYNMQHQIFDMLLRSYPGGLSAMSADYKRSIDLAETYKAKPFSETLISKDVYDRILKDVFTTEIIDIDKDENEVGRTNICFATDLDGDDFDDGTYQTFENMLEKFDDAKIEQILKYKNGTQTDEKKNKKMLYLKKLFIALITYNNVFDMIDKGDVFMKRIINLVKFMTRMVIQSGSEGNRIQAEIGIRLIGKISSNFNEQGEIEPAGVKSIYNSLFGSGEGSIGSNETIDKSFENRKCNILYVIINTVDTAKVLANKKIKAISTDSEY